MINRLVTVLLALTNSRIMRLCLMLLFLQCVVSGFSGSLHVLPPFVRCLLLHVTEWERVHIWGKFGNGHSPI